MYSGAQNKQDYLRRVGSHATKAHPTNGGPLPCTGAWEDLPTPSELTLAELQDERSRLIRMGETIIRGRANEARQRRLTAVNLAIKRLNIEVNEAYNTTVLYEAMRQTLEPDVYNAVLRVARQIRIGHSR